MPEVPSFRLAERTRNAVHTLVVDALTAAAARGPSRVETVLVDLWGVGLAGARTPEVAALMASRRRDPGPWRTVGGKATGSADTVALLDAVASCCLELDEGNKYAAGHPAAHVVPAAVAAARLADEPVTGATFLTAVVAGYEVATRFGHALDRDPPWHTHGHWGATGAAMAAAVVWGLSADRTAAAVDASTSLVSIAPWEVVLQGQFGRNLWMGNAVRAGLDAARLAEAGLVDNVGIASSTLGGVVGTLHPERLAVEPGVLSVDRGYAKRHASCSYTHAAVDVVQQLRRTHDLSADDVTAVRVRIHGLAEPLFGRAPTSRLQAMFSLPVVVAAALVSDEIGVDSLDPDGATFARATAVADRVEVEVADHLTALLPDRRAVEVDLTMRSGEMLAAGAPNPVGDSDHFPLDRDAVVAKIAGLVGVADARRVVDVVDGLAGAASVVEVLQGLP
ncbi:MmgE/PrpD family protein [Rhodococcoides corynebacterioides]|uniref:MmgE/PrpD family protein n=1 Tax=Rhodococcoides corynebacterioides TaxID=53972 RepID=UPI001C9B33C2|nr:MmgE/PrpD family protein [Rhodococcus corynebacterioides]